MPSGLAAKVAREQARARAAARQANVEAEKRELAKLAGTYSATRCGVESQVTMPSMAQRIHGGRKHYVCGLPRGHIGQHRWPGDGRISPLAQWSSW